MLVVSLIIVIVILIVSVVFVLKRMLEMGRYISDANKTLQKVMLELEITEDKFKDFYEFEESLGVLKFILLNFEKLWRK